MEEPASTVVVPSEGLDKVNALGALFGVVVTVHEASKTTVYVLPTGLTEDVIVTDPVRSAPVDV